MARPKKYNADYFPHDNNMRNDRRCKALRSKFNLEGYAVFVMLLETLTSANHFQIEDNKMELELIAGDIDIESKKLNAILEYLIKLGLLVKEGDLISSPMLNDLKSILNELREKDRSRKFNPLENSIKENDLKENEVFQLDNEVFQSENTQSKEKKKKVNEIKEKGNTKISPPVFSIEFLKKGNLHAETLTEEKEKSSAKKERITEQDIKLCKQVFEKYAPVYVWEVKDREQLILLLKKILLTKPELQDENQLAEAFSSFIQKLPEYWRTKKFTIPNLCNNYNEIVSEIRANNQNGKVKKQITQPLPQKQREIKREPSVEEKQKARNDFIKSICENYEKYVETGSHGYIPLWVMYDVLIEEKVLKISSKKLDTYKNKAIEKRKIELQKPQHPKEARTFKNILGNFSQEISKGNEKHQIEIHIKTLAVQDLFEQLKQKQINIKNLFNL